MTLSIDTLTERDIAKTIDHSLLRPELDDAFIEAGCRLAAKYDVASVCVRPADVRRARELLAGTDVAVGTTIGFPHGNHRTETKVFEAKQALADGATELDMVLQIGALRSGRDADVQADIAAIVDLAHANGAIVKVIFENAYLTDDEKVRACRLSEAAGADFVKTSTGFAPSGATHDDLRLMRANTSPHIRVKAAGGVRTLDALLAVMELGVTRIGATATETIILDFRARKAGESPASTTAGSGGRLLMRSVGVGMLGSGFIGEFHTLGLRYVPDARVVANFGAGEERRAAFARRFGSRSFDSIEALCADPEVDLVVVSLPNHLHREAVLAAAAAGKAVACTKPLGRNAAEAADMLRAVTDAGVFNAYLENVVFNHDVMRMHDMIDAGAIGRVTTFRAREGHSGPHAPHFWDAGWPGAARCSTWPPTEPSVPGTCSARTLGIREVFAWGDTLVHGARTGGEDNAVMVIRFEDGRAATCDVSWSSKGGLEGRFEVYGDAGRHRRGHERRFAAGVHRAPGRLPGREGRRRHGLGVPGAGRGAGPRARRDDGRRRREPPRRARAARDVPRRLRRQRRAGRRLSVDAERALGARRGRRPDPGGGLVTTAATTWFEEARKVLDRIATTQDEAIETASQWCTDAIANDGLVHLFGTGHSRIPVEEMFPRYGSYPGFNPDRGAFDDVPHAGGGRQRAAAGDVHRADARPGRGHPLELHVRPPRRDDGLLRRRAHRGAGRDGSWCPCARHAGHRGDVRRPVDVRGSRSPRPAPGCWTRRTSCSTCAPRPRTRW